MWQGAKFTTRAWAFAVSLGAAVVAGGLMAGDASAEGGQLTQKPGSSGCYSSVADCLPAPSLPNPANVEVSPDGSQLYATAGDGVIQALGGPCPVAQWRWLRSRADCDAVASRSPDSDHR